MSSFASFNNILRATAHLIVLLSLLPVSITFVTVQLIRHLLFSSSDASENLEFLPALNREDDEASTEEESSSEDDSSTGSKSEASVSRNPSTPKKHYCVVLTGGKMSKTLHLARCLRSYVNCHSTSVDFKIIVLESQRFRYNATRSSRCVDYFETITSPRDSPDAYMDDIFRACDKYRATHFLPVAAPVEAVYDARLKERLEQELSMTVLHMNHELCAILDDKHKFGSFLKDTLRIDSPFTCQVTSNDQVREWNKVFKEDREAGKLPRNMVLKNLQYDPIHRLDLFQLPCADEALETYLQKIEKDGDPITGDKPWQLQEFLAGGTEYTLMIVVRSNYLVSMTCSLSSASQLNYVHVEVPAIRAWVESFMRSLEKLYEATGSTKYELTGQLCFDFMVVREKDGSEKAYPIECNPRVHTQCIIYNAADTRAVYGAMLLEGGKNMQSLGETMIDLLDRDYGPNAKQQEVYWFYNEFFKIFPNGWLFNYCDDKDLTVRKEMVSCRRSVAEVDRNSTDAMKLLTLVIYLPGFLFAFVLSFPILLISVQSSAFFELPSTGAPSLSIYEHTIAALKKAWDFVDRLADPTRNIEADMWEYDPLPFLFKNHVQVPVRLLATIRTGVEWKKIDFAIGKVVEVGGD